MHTQKITIPADGIPLKAILSMPEGVQSIVIFSHGSGSSRLRPGNKKMAKQFQNAGYATLLCDLLSEEEDSHTFNRFDIDLLSRRLIAIILWLKSHKKYEKLEPVFFGASTGTASALKAASRLDGVVSAIISRGGRPDLVMEYLANVTAPTLLIVGELDMHVLELNKAAYNKLVCPKQLVVVPGASHLFEEPGKSEKVGNVAIQWLNKFVPSGFKKSLAETDAA